MATCFFDDSGFFLLNATYVSKGGLHESEESLERTKICTDLPFVYMGSIRGTVQAFEWKTVTRTICTVPYKRFVQVKNSSFQKFVRISV